MGIVHYFFPWILIHLVYFQESESYSSQINSNTLVGKPQLDLTITISIGLFVLFVAMAIFVYKPRRNRPSRTFQSNDQPVLVWKRYQQSGCSGFKKVKIECIETSWEVPYVLFTEQETMLCQFTEHWYKDVMNTLLQGYHSYMDTWARSCFLLERQKNWMSI